MADPTVIGRERCMGFNAWENGFKQWAVLIAPLLVCGSIRTWGSDASQRATCGRHDGRETAFPAC